MMNIRAKRAFYLLLALNIALIGGIAGTFLLANKIAGQKSMEISLLKADIETNDTTLTNYKQLEQTLKKNKEVEEIAQQVLPQDKNQSAALTQLDEFSAQTGVKIKQVTFNPGTTDTKKATGPTLTTPSSLKGVSILNVSVRCDKTQYENLLNFLKKIENNRRRMQVKSVSLSPSTQVLGQLDQVNLTIDIYLKP